MKTKDHRRPLTSMHWGVYEVQRDNHGAPILAPFADDPDPNPIGLHALGPELADARVKRPAIRAGWLNADKRKRRGEDDFIEVSWDTALDAVASELSRIKTRYGNDAIFGGSYGWSSAGRFHHAQSQIHRFLNCFGGYVRHRDSYSLGAGRVLMPHIFVGLDDLFVTQTSWDVMAQHTELFVTFGGVPSKNAQVAAGGTTEHRIPSALRNMASSGTRFVNISPVRDDLDIEAAWLPVRPNTDTALMLALAQVLVVEGFVNQAFVARCTVGYEQLAAYICGEHDGVAKTPEWAAPICDISAESIRALARDMATHRTMLNIAWALQRADHGEQPFWMLVALGAMLGQIGLPGGGVGIGYGATNTMGSPHVRIKGPTLAQGTNPVAAFIPVARIADCLLNPGQPFEYNGEEHRYPDLRLVYWAGGNPFHHHQDLNRLREAFQQPETIIVNEQFWTATAKHADIVLPATTTLERDDIGYSSRDAQMVAMQQVVPPHAEARDDFQIFAALAQRLAISDSFTEGRSPREWMSVIYETCRHNATEQGVTLPSFEQFWQDGRIDLSSHDAPVIMLEDFRRDPIRYPLQTPSGRIELFSERIASFAYDECAGHPTWYEPVEWLGADRAATYPLHLISDQPNRRLHSQWDPSPHAASEKIKGREPITIHPTDAEARGIAAGDLVRVFNDRGACLAGARLSDAIRPGVVRLSTGAWFDPIGTLDKHGNPNTLTRDQGTSRLSQGCSAQSCLVDIARHQGEVPPLTAHATPRFVSAETSRGDDHD